MNVLVLCEFSGTVRDAFRVHGHDAVSCDLLPTAVPGPHLQADCRTLSDWASWDLVVAHPPCTHLSVSGARYFRKKFDSGEQLDALSLVEWILALPVPFLCLENPIGLISSWIRPSDQIIQPWQFGHRESKATCLWLKGLPKLQPTETLSKPLCGYWDNQTPSGQNKLGPSPTRAARRSTTYSGIAWAMASQWGIADHATA